MQKREHEFLEKFSAAYDLPGAARAAGIGRDEAYRLLRSEEARALLDRRIIRRVSGEMLARIRAEYESIAFSADPEIRVADRMRALELLRVIAASEAEGEDGPTLIVRYEYV